MYLLYLLLLLVAAALLCLSADPLSDPPPPLPPPHAKMMSPYVAAPMTNTAAYTAARGCPGCLCSVVQHRNVVLAALNSCATYARNVWVVMMRLELNTCASSRS